MDERQLIETDIEAFLEQNERKELLRFVTVGSVDDGKSTLIGRLLHDTKGVYDDQLKDASRTTATGETAIDFARITDGLRAEREQGITIDVAYRYFSTPQRKFIIADTPGHVQYTRNMATGASTADVAIILIDARYGVLKQSRRHAYIASLLGIPHLLVCINKMDLTNYDKDVYDTIVRDFQAFSDNLAFGTDSQKRTRGGRQCAGFYSITYLPISALMGVNIVESSESQTPWYSGPTVLEYLETVQIAPESYDAPFRFPVQYVLRPNLNYRGYAGQVVSGSVKKGDAIRVLPSGRTSTVAGIDTYDGEIDEAHPPMSVVLRLADEVDISRGDYLTHEGSEPHHCRDFDAMVVWMSDTPMYADKSYIIKIGTRYVRTNIDEVSWQVVLDTLENVSSQNKLELNEIGKVRFTTHQPIVFDSYKQNRSTGAFIIIDSLTNTTVGAGMILEPQAVADRTSTGDVRAENQVSEYEKIERLSQRAHTLYLAGLPASGRSTLAYGLQRTLFDNGYLAAVIDNKAGEAETLTVNEAAHIAKRMNDAGLIVINCVTSNEMGEVESVIGRDRTHYIHVATPERTCRDWDSNAQYSGGTPKAFVPEAPLCAVDLSTTDLETATSAIVNELNEAKVLLEQN